MVSSRGQRRVARVLRVNCSTKWILFFIAAWEIISRAYGAAPVASNTDAERLVTAAAEAEVRGDVAKSIALLKDAVRSDPDNRLAHWQLGEILVKNKWTTVDDAQQQAASDRLQADYLQLRAASGDSLESQLALPQWCRKHNLKDEARYHWANVLTADPNNKESQNALDVRWVRGRLMTAEEIAADKNAEHVRRREHLAASISKWRYALAGLNQVPEDECWKAFDRLTTRRRFQQLKI